MDQGLGSPTEPGHSRCFPPAALEYLLEADADRRQLGRMPRVAFPQRRPTDPEHRLSGEVELPGQRARVCVDSTFQLQVRPVPSPVPTPPPCTCHGPHTCACLPVCACACAFTACMCMGNALACSPSCTRPKPLHGCADRCMFTRVHSPAHTCTCSRAQFPCASPPAQPHSVPTGQHP